jgi:Dihydrofolate reductase
MRKIVSFMHTSLDGFVAGPAGEMDWIHVDEDMFEYAGRQTDRSDTALYGRVTWQMMQSYWPTAADKPNATKHDIQHSNWYNNVEKVVLSKTMQGENLPNTTIISNNVSDHIKALKQRTGNEIVIFGSPTVIHFLMTEDLVNDLWLFVNPILLVQGIPMFRNIRHKKNLKHVSGHTFSSGVVCLHYELIRNE